jgi:hypothetical protein
VVEGGLHTDTTIRLYLRWRQTSRGAFRSPSRESLRLQPEASQHLASYALCFCSAEDAAEGPSEDEAKPSAVDLVTSAVANCRSGPT